MATRSKRDTTDYLVVHSAATPADMNIGAADINRWHRQRGYFRIGYHFVIRRDGLVETGEDLDRWGAHVRGFNQNSVGICLAGGTGRDMRGKVDYGKPEFNYTKEQIDSLIELLDMLKGYYPDAAVVGHKDLDPRGKPFCPGFDPADVYANRGINRTNITPGVALAAPWLLQQEH